MDEFNLENAQEFLAELKEKEPDKQAQSVKEVIIGLAPMIRELMRKGYTQKEILERLKAKYDLKLEYGTFKNYLSQAKKTGNGGKEDS